MGFSKVLFLGITLLALGACASLHSLSVTPQNSADKNQIEAEVSKLVVLGFNFDNDFLNDLVPRLSQKCPQGKISGLVTKYETIGYLFFHIMKVKTSGYCHDAIR